MASLAEDPRVAELLLSLWTAPDQEAGIAVVDLPEAMRDEVLLTACEGDGLIEFLRRNHCFHGGVLLPILVLEDGWNVADLRQCDRKRSRQLVRDACREGFDIPKEIRLRVRLSDRGTSEAARLGLLRTAGEPVADGSDKATPQHSEDFRSVLWFGVNYSFTANQAAAVKMLWSNWKNGTPDVGDATLLEAVDHGSPPARLNVLFRDSPAWGTMIVRGATKGTHRLSPSSP